MKRTIIGGVLFLAPLAVLMLILGKVYQFGLVVAGPISDIVPVQSVGGVALVNVLAVLLIVALCYLAGYLAQRQLMGARLQKIDAFLIDMIPSYATFKSTVGSVSRQDREEQLLTPVLVRFDDYEQIAFEVERNDGHAVVFLPGAPSAWAGSTVIVEERRVHPLKLPTFQTVALQRMFGRGSLKAREGAVPDKTLLDNRP